MFIKAIILGIIQGLTEFLPISSTGHLIIVSHYIDFKGEFANTFNVVIQFGSILAVVLYFRHKLFPKRNQPEISNKAYNLWGKVLIGIIPAAIAGVLLEDLIDKYLYDSPERVAIGLIAGALLLLFAENRQRYPKVYTTDEITYKDSLVVGIFQCLALWPGMSRSASTIIGGLLVGESREAAAEYSFFLAVPTIAGAAAFKLLKIVKSGVIITGTQWIALLIGCLVSFAVAYIVIAAFMEYIKSKKLAPFAYYRIALGIIVIMIYVRDIF